MMQFATVMPATYSDDRLRYLLPKLQARLEERWCNEVYEPFFSGKFGRVLSNGLVVSDKSKLTEEKIETTGLQLRGASGFYPKVLRQWRTFVPYVTAGLTAADLALPKHERAHIYTFGVHFGDSLYFFRKQYPDALLLAFDSWVGLPQQAKGEVNRNGWVKGQFGAMSGLTDPGSIKARLVGDLGGERGIRLFPGFFNESLTQSLGASLLPATFVDIDSDIYISARQALDWLFAHKLVRAGTVIGYDDWMDMTCTVRRLANGTLLRTTRAMHFEGGEPKAHFEIAQKFNVEFKCVAGSCRAPTGRACDIYSSAYGAVFLVVSVGITADHGFEMNEVEFDEYKKRNQNCYDHRRKQSYYVS